MQPRVIKRATSVPALAQLVGVGRAGSARVAALRYFWQEVTATGAFTLLDLLPISTLFFRARAFGAGGGGGCGAPGSNSCGGDGGNGGYADTGLVVFDGTGTGRTASGIIGAPGGGSSTGGSIATAGGTTTLLIGSFSLVANGGDYGRNFSVSSGLGGPGGTASGGVINIPGAAGLNGAASAAFGIGGLGGIGYPGRGVPANQQEPQSVGSYSAGNNGLPGGVLIEWWTE